jgi:integrase
MEDGRRKYKGSFATQALAQDHLDRIRLGLPSDEPEKPKGPTPTLSTLKTGWLASRVVDGIRSVDDDRNRWTKHVEPLLGGVAIDAVNDELIRSLIARMVASRPPLDPATQERVLYTLSAFYRWLIQTEQYQSNPVQAYFARLSRHQRKQLRTKHNPETDTQFLKDRDDRGRVFDKLKGTVKIAYGLTAFCGLRPGEAIALRWPDVDLDAAKLTVRAQVRHGKRGIPKSGKPRPVEIIPDFLDVLKTWKKQAKGDLVCPPTKNRKKTAHLGPKLVTKEVHKALLACGLPIMKWVEAGRHSYGAAWAFDGLDMVRLQKQLGHASIETTMHYAHLAEGMKAQLAINNVKLAR